MINHRRIATTSVYFFHDAKLEKRQNPAHTMVRNPGYRFSFKVISRKMGGNSKEIVICCGRGGDIVNGISYDKQRCSGISGHWPVKNSIFITSLFKLKTYRWRIRLCCCEFKGVIFKRE